MSTSMPNWSDPAALERWIDDGLDAAEPRVRAWRQRILGRDAATIVSEQPGRRRVSMEMPMGEFVIVREHARRRDLTVVKFMRAATAYALAAEGVPPEQREWLGHFGVWSPP